MKTKSLILSIATAALAFAATPAEAGPRSRNGCNPEYSDRYRTGGWNNGACYQPVRCYQQVRYVPVYSYSPRPALQIGFSFGGNRAYGSRGGCR
ncbi:MAG TPA: hypothetical protein PLS03_02905 [Terrimicrobiaceae bacterium]|nr:hypothetical protein [Terrimicrobiaceae bacterium]